MDREADGPDEADRAGNGLARWRHHAAERLGLAAPPPGYRPPPGAGLRRMMFGFIWLILGVVQTVIWVNSRSWVTLALAVAWFLLAAYDIARARRLFQAENRPFDPDEDRT